MSRAKAIEREGLIAFSKQIGPRVEAFKERVRARQRDVKEERDIGSNSSGDTHQDIALHSKERQHGEGRGSTSPVGGSSRDRELERSNARVDIQRIRDQERETSRA